VPTSQEIIALARYFDFVREAGPNTGLRVEAIQRWSGGMKGDSWCAYWVSMVLDLAFKGKSPLPRHGSCQFIYDYAKTKWWVTDTPASGDLFLYVNAGDHAHHIGIVTKVEGTDVYGIAGNTSSDGKSSNGDGVYERQVWPQKFIGYPRD